MDKKEYQTPQIKEVKLSPEEAVLTACKAATGDLKAQFGCKGPDSCVNKASGS